MKTRITKQLISNHIKAIGDFDVHRFHITAGIQEVHKIVDGKLTKSGIKNLVAGNSYVITPSIQLTPHKVVCTVHLHPSFQANGIANSVGELLPISETSHDCSFVFDCKRNMALSEIDYCVAVTIDGTNYPVWG